MQNHQQAKSAYLVTRSSMPVILIGWIALIIVCYFFIDQPLAQYIHVHDIDQEQSLLHHFMQTISSLGDGSINIAIPIILFVVGWVVVPSPTLRVFAGVWIIALIANGLVVDILKISAGRARPTEWFTTLQYGFYFLQFRPGMWSFPSGHAIIISTSMTMISLRWPRYEILCVLIILLICVSRIILEQHFLSDVLSGMLLGTYITTQIYKQIANSHRWGRYLR